jgi:geranylgeranyl diphosphate synthase type II
LDLESYLDKQRIRIDDRLAALLDSIGADPGCPEILAAAMGHALLGPGKRLRPLLCLAAAHAVASPGQAERPGTLDVACSLEMVHAYSLVHDDLPAMDDDDLRRGKPTCHRAFGEAVAILAGDALLTHAFAVLSGGLESERVADGVRLLAEAAGAAGMVGGQVDDVEPDAGQAVVASRVESIHQRKTAALMEAAVRLGGRCAGADKADLEDLGRCGSALGLAFQIADDILAEEGDQQRLGRVSTADRDQNRRTHPRAVGLEGSRRRVSGLIDEAQACLVRFGDRADPLRAIARRICQRAVTSG